MIPEREALICGERRLTYADTEARANRLAHHLAAHGIGRDGRAFKMPMARHIYFAKMTADDIDAIVAWVRTIPPNE